MKVSKSLLAAIGLAVAAMLNNSAAFADDSEPERATVPPLFAVLLGGNEVSPEGVANAGDPDGRGSATVLIRGTTLCFGITVDGIEKPTLAHIHQAPAGENGPIVVDFIPPANGNPGASSRCLHNLDEELLKQIQEHASGFYVNVHNDPYPAGAVRGQLF
jgi:CHRD domain